MIQELSARQMAARSLYGRLTTRRALGFPQLGALPRGARRPLAVSFAALFNVHGDVSGACQAIENPAIAVSVLCSTSE